VSIVIDQTILAMNRYMDISLGNIYYLAAHASQRFNTMTDDVFWHKNSIHKKIILNYEAEEVPEELEEEIEKAAIYAKNIIKNFIEDNNIDLIFAHNISHPYNFITAVGLNYYLEERRRDNYTWPKVITWWHDSHFERSIFNKPNSLIKKYLRYLPGTHLDGVVFINEGQKQYFIDYLDQYKRENKKLFLDNRTTVIPNTIDIEWEWRQENWSDNNIVFPTQNNYNDSFFDDIGVVSALGEIDKKIEDAVFLLQHTRIVPRKKIGLALKLAFELYERFEKQKAIVLLVSGHSGDEQNRYLDYLKKSHQELATKYATNEVLLIFGEAHILPHREIIVDKKYYAFDEIPGIIASKGGIGTYFSEVEGFGNNLLEMMSAGLPTVINRYEVYKKYIAPFDFKLPYIDNCKFCKEIVDAAYNLLIHIKFRNQTVFHNLVKLDKNLSHREIVKKLKPLIENIFFKSRI
jgi:mannosylglucosylglycerate synthase